jgi:flavin-dependent dehydrogenase
MKNNYSDDKRIVIAGGGPAGIATAISLAKRGILSTILETNKNPAEKPGDTIEPIALPVLKVLGVDHLLKDAAHTACYGNNYSWESEVAEVKDFFYSRWGHGWHLHRNYFEKELLSIAKQLGVTVSYCRIKKVEQCAQTDNWQLQTVNDGIDKILNAHFVVDATGRNALIARSAGVRRIQYDNLVGIVARFSIDATAPILQYTYLQAVENGWWSATALRGNIVVTTYMTDANLITTAMQKSSGYRQLLQQSPLVYSLFPENFIPAAEYIYTRSASTSRLSTIWGQNWLSVGDAAYTFDPISSYGIISALGSGYYAGNAIADHLEGADEALPAYQYLTEKAFDHYLHLWKQQYALQQRWPESLFWKKRNG